MEYWQCAFCGTINPITNYVCMNCGCDQDDTIAWLKKINKNEADQNKKPQRYHKDQKKHIKHN